MVKDEVPTQCRCTYMVKDKVPTQYRCMYMVKDEVPTQCGCIYMVKDEVPFTHGSVGVWVYVHRLHSQGIHAWLKMRSHSLMAAWVCGCMYIGYTAKAHVHG